MQSFYLQTLSVAICCSIFEIDCARKRWKSIPIEFYLIVDWEPARNGCFSIISAQCLCSLECYWIHRFLLWHQWVIQFLKKNIRKTRTFQLLISITRLVAFKTFATVDSSQQGKSLKQPSLVLFSMSLHWCFSDKALSPSNIVSRGIRFENLPRGPIQSEKAEKERNKTNHTSNIIWESNSQMWENHCWVKNLFKKFSFSGIFWCYGQFSWTV